MCCCCGNNICNCPRITDSMIFKNIDFKSPIKLAPVLDWVLDEGNVDFRDSNFVLTVFPSCEKFEVGSHDLKNNIVINYKEKFSKLVDAMLFLEKIYFGSDI